MVYTFAGQVFFRSSKVGASGPPGEAQVLALNPGRRTRILAATGWADLEAGSLNLKVGTGVVDTLGTFAPLLSESASDIVYPAPYEHIPRQRKQYWYYSGILKRAGTRQAVLIRRAEVALPDRVELFAVASLTRTFQLEEGQWIDVDVHAA